MLSGVARLFSIEDKPTLTTVTSSIAMTKPMASVTSGNRPAGAACCLATAGTTADTVCEEQGVDIGHISFCGAGLKLRQLRPAGIRVRMPFYASCTMQ